jgi:hypothetical protein
MDVGPVGRRALVGPLAGVVTADPPAAATRQHLAVEPRARSDRTGPDRPVSGAIPGHVLLVAAQRPRGDQQTAPQPWDRLPSARQQYWLDRARRVLEAGLEVLDPTLLDPRHVLLVRGERWALQHPLRCRPDLVTCAVHSRLMELDDDQLESVPVGDWPVLVGEDGRLTIGSNPPVVL